MKQTGRNRYGANFQRTWQVEPVSESEVELVQEKWLVEPDIIKFEEPEFLQDVPGKTAQVTTY